MTLPEDVFLSMSAIDVSCVYGRFIPNEDAWQTIRAHLLSQDAEIARLNVWIIESHKATRKAFLAERHRLAAADALLRFMRTRFDAHMDDSDRTSIDAHLQGAGDEAAN